MKLSKILSEGRKEEFIKKYSTKLGKNVVDRITKVVSPKFLDWVGEVLDLEVIDSKFDGLLADLIQTLNTFEKISSNLPKTDINQYVSFDELKDSIEKYKNRPRREYQKVDGGNVVYSDDRYFVVNPLTHSASCYYGKGTKWCTTSDNPQQFIEHNADGKLFYILDRTKDTNDPLYKIALLKKFEGDEIFYDAKDDVIKSSLSEYWGEPKYKLIMDNVLEYMDSEFAEQLEIWRDKERAKKERIKIEKLRIQRIIEQNKEMAEERRATGEWDLTNPDIDEEGILANAVLKYLDSNGDYKILNNQDKETISKLKEEIEEITNEYNNSEDVRGDLLDKISDLEDLLEEYSDYIDVYSLIPDGEYYDMKKFTIVTDPFGEEYCAGDHDKMESSAKDYVEQLIDDIGYEGFSSGFAENYLDEDEIKRDMEYYIDSDVRDNPEIYLSDGDKELSSTQRERINYLRQEIEDLKEKLKLLREEEYEIEDDDVERLEQLIENMEDEIVEKEDEITETEENPEGDYNEDAISEKVDDIVEERMTDPISWLNDWGLDYKNYVNKEDFIEGVLDSDGFGIMNSYDGSYDEVNVLGNWIYVMRVN